VEEEVEETNQRQEEQGGANPEAFRRADYLVDFLTYFLLDEGDLPIDQGLDAVEQAPDEIAS